MKKQREKSEKSQAGIITIVLLVLISIIGVLIVYNFVVPFVSEKAGEIPSMAERLMLAQALSVEDWEPNTEAGTSCLDVVVSRDSIPTVVDFHGLNFTIETDETTCIHEEQDADLEPSETKTFTICLENCSGNVTGVSVEPLFIAQPPTPGGGGGVSPNFVAYYKFDNDVLDYARENDCIVYGPRYVQGIKEKALEFDGVDDYLDCGDNTSFDIINNLTISAWVKTDAGGTIIGKDWRNSYQLEVWENGIYFTTNSWVNIAEINVCDGSWHHIAVVYDSGVKKIYIDGELKPLKYDRIDTLESDTASVWIGNSLRNKITYENDPIEESNKAFNGTIDEVKIWSQVLSAEEIKTEYDALAPCTDTDGGINYYEKGVVTDKDGVIGTDRCGNIPGYIGQVLENFCSSIDTKVTRYYPCPNGCEDGACVGGEVEKKDTLGEQKVAIILMDYINDGSEQPAETYREAIFDSEWSINNFIRESSYYESWLTGDVFGWYHVNNDEIIRPTSQQIFEATSGENIDFLSYDRFIIYTRSVNNKMWGSSSFGKVPIYFSDDITVNAGISHIGTPASPMRLPWDVSMTPNMVTAHELIHSYGIPGHANAYECGDFIITSDKSKCIQKPRGDALDIMGGRYWASQPSACYKEELGWIDEDEIITVQETGEYALYPYENSDSEIKAIKIPLENPIPIKTVDPNVEIYMTYYYLEYRIPKGVDKRLKGLSEGIYGAPEPVDINGILIKAAFFNEGKCTTTYLLDMHPESFPKDNPYHKGDFIDPFLNIGEEFYDPDNELLIRVNGLSEDGGMLIDIEY